MTRMWMVEPICLCDQHLKGEHYESHMINGTIKKKMSITGYIENNCIEPKAIKDRHEALANEMIKRKMNHKSPLNDIADISYLSQKIQNYKVNIHNSYWELMQRCPDCKKKIADYFLKRFMGIIVKKARHWSYSGNCPKDICLSYDDLLSMGYEVFTLCLDQWDWKKSSFPTFLYNCLHNKFHMEANYKKMQTYELNESIELNRQKISLDSWSINGPDKQVEFKMLLESLSSQSQYMILSAINTPIGLINQAKKEIGKVNVCKKRIQRYLVEEENWSIYQCRKSFDEIEMVLKY